MATALAKWSQATGKGLPLDVSYTTRATSVPTTGTLIGEVHPMLTRSLAEARFRPVFFTAYGFLILLVVVSSACTKYRVALPDGGDDAVGNGAGGNSGVSPHDGQAVDVTSDSPQVGFDAAVDQKVDLVSDGGGDKDGGKSTSANGGSCTVGSDCASGNCIENVCCDTACTDTCHSCRNALTASSPDGTCGVIASGKDDPKSRCGAAATSSSCGNTGHCDGKGACEEYGSTTVCLAASCVGGGFAAASTCDGKGACTPSVTQDCKGFDCTLTAGCATTCAGDPDCLAGYCSPAMTCAAKKIDGSTCMANNECVHGTCVGGLCCENACAGTCLSCSNVETGAANGLCRPISSGGSSKGKCAADTTACGHDGACDGNGACRFQSATTSCRTASCTNGTATNAANCDGAGSCPAVSTQVCSPNVCNGAACGMTCTSNTACATGAACVSGKCTICGTAGLSACPNACVNLQTDKQNCGACGTACEGYQYCHASKCTPTYAWTRVLPVAPLDAISQIQSAAVGSTGDIFVNATIFAGATLTTVTFSNATEPNTQASIVASASTVVLGRYTSANVLELGTDLAFLFAGHPTGTGFPNGVSNLALTSLDDVMLGGVDIGQQPPGPGAPITFPWLLARFNSANFLLREWATTYPIVNASPVVFRTIISRPTRGDYLTIGSQLMQVLENAATPTSLGNYIANTAGLGSDKTTLWLAGGNAGDVGLLGAYVLNPWSPTTTNIGAGQSFIIGARDNGMSFGPWLTINAGARPAAFSNLAVTATGDLIVLTAGGGRGDTGAVSLNGREILSVQDSSSIFKLATATGTVVWKASLTTGLPLMAVAPDGAVIAVSSQTSTYGLTMYADADGSVPASFTGSGQAQAIVAGSSSLYVVGVVSGSADFNPGAKTDIQGNLPGIFITRFAY